MALLPEENFPGDRIVLVECKDPYTRLQPGAMGTVHHVDAIGTVHVDWDDGHMLGLIAGEDQWLRVEGLVVAI